MSRHASSHLNKVAAALAASVLGAGLFPTSASAQYLPGGEIRGTVASINSTFNISVDDANGGIDNVELHQGTIINPTGLTLEPGMPVTIVGYGDGGQFDANEIDTPYTYNGPLPTPLYYGPGFWYPGFAYGYGPSFSLVIDNGPIVIRRPWVGHWFDHQPIPRVAYRPPVFVQPRPEMVRPPAPPPLSLYRPPAPVAQAPRPQFVQQQPRPQFVPQQRPQAPVARAPIAQAPRPQFAPQARQATPAARATMRSDRRG
ncbi:MAG TPA: hypothetical protein VN905_05740 [Candidatus Binatia bacterium]|nr:hypothetical protein [Candidatus Binatia bacterium]